MALSDNDRKILEEILATDGACLDSKRCHKCPFRAQCLPEFLNPEPPSQPQRKAMAMDVLTHHALLDDEITMSEVEKEYPWERK